MNKYILFLIIYVIFLYVNKAYFKFYPTIPVYPNNKNDLYLVKRYISNRNKDDIDFFYLTNKTVSLAFLPYVNETKDVLDRMLLSQNKIILSFKYIINRIRPWQLDKKIKPIDISTAQTPAYPAGHAYQAYLLAKKLSKKYPQKKRLFYDLAIKCDICRVKAGLHYPSDGIFARKLVDFFNP